MVFIRDYLGMVHKNQMLKAGVVYEGGVQMVLVSSSQIEPRLPVNSA